MQAGSLAVRAIGALSLALLLASCGGGGGGGGPAAPATYTIGGTVTGLAGTAPNLVLQNNLGNNLAVSKNGAFTFSTPLPSGAAYSVTVLTKPTNPPQGCTVTLGAGTVGGANVTNITVACVSDASTIGGTVFVTGGGSLGSGLVLQNNLGNNLTVSAAGTFTFSTPVSIGANYDVTVLTQPSGPTQTCMVTNGSGTVPVNDVSNVTVTCTTNTYTIGGSVSGWVGGTALRLRNNNNPADEIAISSTGTVPFTFSTPIASGGSYQVTVSAQPSGPSQTCTVFGGGPGIVGNANVTNVAVICGVNTYTIGGTVTGLLGTGLKLRNNNNPSDEITIPKTGPFSFTFATPIASGASYEVTVSAQPTNPSQTCTVTNGGPFAVGGANVTNVSVSCTTNTYTIGGTVNGLSGAGLKLRNNNNPSDEITIPKTGPFNFTFGTPIASGASYEVTVSAQPSGPTQTCSVTNGGPLSVGGANVTNVVVNCTTNSYTIGGTVTGLSGTGLKLRNNNNAGDEITIAKTGPFSFTFGTAIASGATYEVTVSAQPTGPSQTCSVTNGGPLAVGGANVTNVSISCTTNTYTIGGTVSGLLGTGLKLRNNNNALDEITVSGTGTVPFTFGTPIASGASYEVTVSAQPSGPTQNCTVSNGGPLTLGGANVTNVVVNCTTNSYTVGGTVSGLSGTGLKLRNNNNAGDEITVSGTGTVPFTFGTTITSGQSYEVTVSAQPSGPTQTCSVTNGGPLTVGGANVTNVSISCTTNTYTIGGTVIGLLGTGLKLRNNNNPGDEIVVSGTGTVPFTFGTPIASGASYEVTVSAQPSGPTQTCTVTNGGPLTVGGANVANVSVSCTTNSYTIGGTVTGLLGTGLKLRNNNNAGDEITIAKTGPFSFTFGTPIASGAAYAVTVSAQPSDLTQECTVSGGGSGTVGGANITNVSILCTTKSYTIGGTVTGLAGAGLKLRNNNNPGDEITIAKSGPFSFTFGTPIASGASYAVTVSTDPTNLSQTCTVAGGGSGTGSGTVTNANITDISISCTTKTFTVGGTLSGYNNFGGGGVALRLNGSANAGNNLLLNANGNFTFTGAPLVDGSAYSVTVFVPPIQQSCTVTGGGLANDGTGNLAGANVVNIVVNCATTKYTVGGTISIVGGGSLGTGLKLRNAYDPGGINTEDLIVPANASGFTFSTQVAYNSPYSVSVIADPSGPTQTCSVASNGSGTVLAAVTNIAISCTTNTYNIGVTVTGLSTAGTTTGVVLQNNGGDNKAFTTNSTSNFTTKIASGATYNVTVLTQPTNPSQTCTVAAPTGTVGGADVSLSVSCTTNTYNIGVTVTGLSTAGTTTGVVLQNNGGDNKTFTTNSTSNFTTKIASGATYNVTVLTQPTNPSQTCTVAAPTGTVGGADVSLSVSCTTNTYTVGGTISGLGTGTTGVVLQNNAGNNLPVTANGAFSFSTKIASGAAYSVTVLTQPSTPTQTCLVTAGTGTVGAADVNSVSISCTTNTYTVGGSVTGLTGANPGLVLQNNGGDNKTISANGTFSFATPVASGAGYTVTVLTQPSVPTQACTVVNGTGTVGGANVTNVSVVCAIPTARFAYVPNFGDNTVSIYAVNATTGQLRHRGYIAAGTGPNAVATDPLGKYVYVTNETSGTVSAYSINAATGALTSAGAVPAGISPESIVVEPSGHFVYVANAGPGNQTGTVSAYSINSGTGALAAIDADAVTGGVQTSIPAGTNPTSLAVDPLGRFVFVANGNGNNISVFSINAVSGALTPVGTPFAAGQKPMWITVDPSGKFVYATNFNSNTVSAYKIDATLGLIPITPDVTTGTGPRSVAVDPTGKFAYVVNQNGGTTGSVSAYNIDSVTGALSTTGTVDVLTGNLPVGITIDPFSKLAYVENVGSNDISAYSINGSTGGLTALPRIIGHDKNQAMAMTKGAPLIYTPKFAYVANSGSGNVSAYTIDAGTPPTPGTGVLTAIGLPVAAGTTPKSVSVDPLGRYAYVANSGSANVSAFTIGSGGALSPIGSPVSAGTNPASVSVDPSGRFAYVANAGDGLTASTVSAYTIDSGTGALSANGTAPAGTGPASVAIDPSGRFAYVANFNSNNISAYTISISTGALTQIDFDPVTTPLVIDNFPAGTGPQSVSVHPSGNFAYVANGDGTIWAYRIDSTNGALISIGTLAVGTNPASIAFDAAGKYLYVARKGDGLVAAYLIDPSTGGLTSAGTIATGTSPASVTLDASGQFAYVANSGSANVSAYTVNSGTGALSPISGSPFGAGSTPSSVTTTGTIQ